MMSEASFRARFQEPDTGSSFPIARYAKVLQRDSRKRLGWHREGAL